MTREAFLEGLLADLPPAQLDATLWALPAQRHRELIELLELRPDQYSQVLSRSPPEFLAERLNAMRPEMARVLWPLLDPAARALAFLRMPYEAGNRLVEVLKC